MEATFGVGVAAIVTACLLGLAFFTDHKKTLRGFFLMDRELPMGSFVFSLLAANLSVGNFLIFAAVWGFEFGIGGFLWFVVNLSLNVVVYRLFEPTFEDYFENPQNNGSVHEFISLTFGQTPIWTRRIRLFAAITTITGLLFAIVFELHLTATILAQFLKVDPASLFLALTVLICIYSAMGGYQSLIFTDYVNSAAMTLGFGAILVILGFVIFSPAAGVTTKLSPIPWNPFAIGLPNVLSICSLGAGWFLVAMDQWQRTAALKDRRSIESGLKYYLGFTIFFAAVYSAVGILDKRSILPAMKVSHASHGSGGNNPLADLFLAAVTSNAPKLLFGLFAVALLAAATSTANTFLIVCGHSFTGDVLSGRSEEEANCGVPDNYIDPRLEFGQNAIIGMGGLVLGAWTLLGIFGLLRDPLQFFFVAYSIQFALLAPILSVRLPERFKPGEQAVFHSLWVGAVVSIAWGLVSWSRSSPSGQVGGLANSWLVLTPLVTCVAGTVTLFAYRPVSVLTVSLQRGIVRLIAKGTE